MQLRTLDSFIDTSCLQPPMLLKADVQGYELEVLKGGKVDEPYEGKGLSSASFSEAGEYVLQLTANDYSGNGGGGEVCCWTTAMVKVTVTP